MSRAIPAQTSTGLADRVSAVLALAPFPECRPVVHQPEPRPHVLITAELDEFWKSMPWTTQDHLVDRALRHWADAFKDDDDLGVSYWGRDANVEALVVAECRHLSDEADWADGYLWQHITDGGR